jgi:hypothetical protein
MENRSRKAIVITSIFPPTEAVKRFAALNDYSLIVAGDRKTPADWQWAGVEYLSLDGQMQQAGQLANCLPQNHYCRKMTGYLQAIRKGAEVIVDTDDDNLPKPGWHFPSPSGEFDTLLPDLGFVNIYKLFTTQHIWPRGLPLQQINSDASWQERMSAETANVGVWQGLADGDPDVDAIYRLTDNTPCYFNERQPVVLSPGTICPFNSQNTLFVKALFPLLYLPATVTFRFTDILRGLVAQPIMWQHGFCLGFTGATVVQERNPHNYLKDFEDEIPMYRHAGDIPQLVAQALAPQSTVCQHLQQAYAALAAQGIVQQAELGLLNAWINDLNDLGIQ